jgi:GxxExxY protein
MQSASITSDQIVHLARELHGQLGPKLSVEAYEAALAFELEQRGLKVERQREVKLRSGDDLLDMGFVADLLVDCGLVVRFVSLTHLDPVNEAWLLDRLDLPGSRAGVFLDFRRTELEVLALSERGS